MYREPVEYIFHQTQYLGAYVFDILIKKMKKNNTLPHVNPDIEYSLFTEKLNL